MSCSSSFSTSDKVPDGKNSASFSIPIRSIRSPHKYCFDVHIWIGVIHHMPSPLEPFRPVLEHAFDPLFPRTPDRKATLFRRSQLGVAVSYVAEIQRKLRPEPSFKLREAVKDLVEVLLDPRPLLPSELDEMGLKPINGQRDRGLCLPEIFDRS